MSTPANNIGYLLRTAFGQAAFVFGAVAPAVVLSLFYLLVFAASELSELTGAVLAWVLVAFYMVLLSHSVGVASGHVTLTRALGNKSNRRPAQKVPAFITSLWFLPAVVLLLQADRLPPSPSAFEIAMSYGYMTIVQFAFLVSAATVGTYYASAGVSRKGLPPWSFILRFTVGKKGFLSATFGAAAVFGALAMVPSNFFTIYITSFACILWGICVSQWAGWPGSSE